MILVTTPNGKVGSEVIKQLQVQGQTVRVGAHTVEKARAAFPGLEVVHFDFENLESVRRALEGVDAVYLASPGEMLEGPVNAVVDAAKGAGVKRVVRLSAAGVEYGDSALRRAELHIEASGLEHTFLRPNWFMQNYSTMRADGVRQGAIYEAAADGRSAFIDARDIAAVAVAALTQDGHNGKAYTLTGSEALSRDEVATLFSSALGREVKYVSVGDEQLRQGMAGAPQNFIELISALYSYVRDGATATVTDDVEKVTGRAPIRFEQFVQDHLETWR